MYILIKLDDVLYSKRTMAVFFRFVCTNLMADIIASNFLHSIWQRDSVVYDIDPEEKTHLVQMSKSVHVGLQQ